MQLIRYNYPVGKVDQALSDGPNSWPLDQMASLLEKLKLIDNTIKTVDGE
jgi:3-deoxy-D-manno-octulosonic acid (KDO) 8-phosphate synthase